MYAQFPDGRGDVAGDYNDTVVALTKDLKVKDYFTPSGGKGAAIPKGISVPGVTPAVFAWKGKDVVVAAARDGRVFLLDGSSLGGSDHHTPLAVTGPISSPDAGFAGNGIAGTFSSWEDETGTRWVYASVQGPLAGTAKFGQTNGEAGHGSVVAFRIVDRDGKSAFEQTWVSRDMQGPAPTVIANGLVFALASGDSTREAKENGSPYSISEREKMSTRATLYVLDAATGAELYSSGNMASVFSHNSGIAIANRRIYFTTHDNYVYSLGFLAEQPQLTGK
jgi:hypothetical protein